MKQNTLSAENRTEAGRGPSRRLRAAGKIPAVIYGVSGTRSLSIDGPGFRALWAKLRGISALIEVVEEGRESVQSLIEEIQRDPITDEVLHIDFKEISADVELQTNIGVRFVGESAGVKSDGAFLDVLSHEVEVRCLPKDLPELIVVDVSELEVGDAIHIRDLKSIEGVLFTEDRDKTIVSCVLPSLVEEEEGVDGEGSELSEEESEGQLGETSEESGEEKGT
ncbi:MAG: 50S ribosomal protein L25 [Candidatus Moanabacter tarae]|uniref:Large ribosomal subunit protein bL25 n=1 Tax=Candidatus Moanibacter tarae TaxID=2200854 RepID=A0A2Z4AFJ6_9BACT|nr:MAG: 50S ribosomal protein L25 [Candidatus Moanabacter tarae]